MTTSRIDMIDVDGITERLGDGWEPEQWGDDTIRFNGPGRTVIVSYDPESDPDVPWIHASISYHQQWRMPSYSDLKQLYAAVFPGGHAYQAFVPPEEHVNIRSNVLHLWARLDGAPVLPNFGKFGTI